MSLVTARKKRTQLFGTIIGLLVIVGLVSSISLEDPDGASIRIAIIMVTLAAGLWMRRSWELIPVALLTWLVPNFVRGLVDDTYQLFDVTMMLEAVGALAIAGLASLTRESLKDLEIETLLIGSNAQDMMGINPDSGVFHAHQLRPILEVELARSRRFGRVFALVLVGIDELRQKYDYRDPSVWEASLAATARLLRNTRHNVDRVFHYGDGGFALILPETSENDVVGMVRRLRRLARSAIPAEGEPGGPLPAHYGATFYPACATTVDDLIRRAEIALRIAEKNTLRYQLDSAEAPGLPPAETLRRPDIEVTGDVPDATTEMRDESITAIAEPETAAINGESEVEERVPAVVAEAEEIAAAAEVSATDDPSMSETPVEEPVVASDIELQPVDEEIEVPAALLGAAADPIAEMLGTAAAATDDVAIAADLTTAAHSFEEIDDILRQMDETLTLIRKMRSTAA